MQRHHGNVSNLFRESLPERPAIRLEQDLGAHIPLMAFDRNRLKQALINLLKNAMEAMSDGWHHSREARSMLTRSSASNADGNDEKKRAISE